jgi:hypothetical protein
MSDQQHIKRWYDLDLRLSKLVTAMEQMNDDHCQLFGYLISHLFDEIVNKGNRGEFFRELDWGTIRGIWKSKSRRRWYDQDDVVHKAFNLIYSLADKDKILVGQNLATPAELVAGYELYSAKQNQPLELDTVCEIIETCFRDGDEQAAAKYAYLLQA